MRGTKENASRDVLGPLRPREEDLVYVDGLTGLCNQRLLNELLDEKFGELVSLAGSFALVMIDLDLFKEVNDRYGHLSGDEVLRMTGEVLRGTFRESDLIFRYGGDEFLVLLPGASAVEAEALGRRARETIEKHEFFEPEERERIDVPLSFSIGVAAWPGDGESGRAVLASADERLYAEKRIHLAARRRKRAFATGAIVLVALILLTASVVVFLEGRSPDVVEPIVVVDPAPAQPDPVETGEREALLREIAELQRQIEILRARRSEAPSSEHGGAQIPELERKIEELTAQLAAQSNDAGQVPAPAPDRPVTPVPAEPVRRPPAQSSPPRETPAAPRVVVTPARLKTPVVPAYPPFAKERGIEATINVEVLVDATGRVAEANVVGKVIGFGFEDAARRAALASEWSPATRNGTPFPMRTNLQVRFQITR